MGQLLSRARDTGAASTQMEARCVPLVQDTHTHTCMVLQGRVVGRFQLFLEIRNHSELLLERVTHQLGNGHLRRHVSQSDRIPQKATRPKRKSTQNSFEITMTVHNAYPDS